MRSCSRSSVCAARASGAAAARRRTPSSRPSSRSPFSPRPTSSTSSRNAVETGAVRGTHGRYFFVVLGFLLAGLRAAGGGRRARPLREEPRAASGGARSRRRRGGVLRSARPSLLSRRRGRAPPVKPAPRGERVRGAASRCSRSRARSTARPSRRRHSSFAHGFRGGGSLRGAMVTAGADCPAARWRVPRAGLVLGAAGAAAAAVAALSQSAAAAVIAIAGLWSATLAAAVPARPGRRGRTAANVISCWPPRRGRCR